MSALFPAFDQPLPSSDNFNGRSLSDNLEKLDSFAASLNLTTLSKFIDAYSMALEYLGDESLLPPNCPPEAWYTPQEGFATVSGLLHYIESHSDLLLESITSVIVDLENLSALLHKAMETAIRFHLLVD